MTEGLIEHLFRYRAGAAQIWRLQANNASRIHRRFVHIVMTKRPHKVAKLFSDGIEVRSSNVGLSLFSRGIHSLSHIADLASVLGACLCGSKARSIR